MPMTTEASGTPRTLGDDLRARSDAELAALLHARPDLLSPLPGDLSQLATRAGARASVQRALERLDTFALQIAEALAVAGSPATYDALARLLPGGTEALPTALASLRAHALVWGGEQSLRLVRTAQELLAPSPQRPGSTGLGPALAEAVAALSPRRAQELLVANGLPATADTVGAARALTNHFADRGRLTATLAEAPDRAREVLDRLVWGPPYGEVSAQPAQHLRWLLDRALLVPTAPGTVVLPREIALGLRDGRAHRELCPLPPPLSIRADYDPDLLDSTAAGQAHTALGMVESLLSLWEQEPPGVLRTGGLGVRELKRTATSLNVPEPEAVFWTELAYAAGLVASGLVGGESAAEERYAPTPASDDWLRQPAAERWVRLANAWLATTRVPGLVGERAPQPSGSRGRGGERMLATLGPGLDRGPVAELRRAVLRELAALPPGTAPEPPTVRERLRWAAPRRMDRKLHTLLCSAVLTEAEHLGFTSRGALAGYARPLLAALTGHSVPAAAEALAAGAAEVPGAVDVHPPEVDAEAAADSAAGLLAPLLPQPLDHFLLQADLTAVAPGPLLRELARTLGALADVESTGGATVYRFSAGSVRRALDAGWTATELHAFLGERSRTPVPQPLSYLIDDVARRHGRLRAGAAHSYLRCDDETLLTQLLADRRLASLGLRRIAPTVVVSQAEPRQLLAQLREHGHAPAAESAEGAEGPGGAVLPTGHPLRTPPRRAPDPLPDSPPGTDDALLNSAVRAIRSGDHAAGAAPGAGGRPPADPPRELPRTPAAETLTTLRAAARDGALVWIGYVGADGVAGQRVLAPVRVEGGFVTAFDHTAEEVRTYPLHRITGTAQIQD